MENVNVKIAIGSMNKCKLGYASKVLMGLNMSRYSVNLKRAYKLLTDMSLFNKIPNRDEYIAYVISKSIGIPNVKVLSDEQIDDIEDRVENLSRYLITFEEYQLLKDIYTKYVEGAIINIARKSKSIFDFTVKIDYERILFMYLEDIPKEEVILKRFTEVLKNFSIYNCFNVDLSYAVFLIADSDGKKSINIKYTENSYKS